jgi:hypothetical protein
MTSSSSLVVALSPAVSLLVRTPWWLNEAAKCLYDTMGAWGVQQWTKGGGLGFQATDKGSPVAHYGTGTTVKTF